MYLRNFICIPIIIFITGYLALKDYDFHVGWVLWFGIWFAFVIYYGYENNWEYSIPILWLSFAVWCGAVVNYS